VPLQVRVFSNHVGVTTIERPDQGHLYPLGEPRDTRHSQGTNLRPPAQQGVLYLKSYLFSIFAGYSEPLLGVRAALHPASTIFCFYDGALLKPSSIQNGGLIKGQKNAHHHTPIQSIYR
jgi:hypothetical protein